MVTGAGRGIGRAIAMELSKAGADVVLLARSGDEVDSVAELIRAAGVRAWALKTDIGDPESVAAAARRIMKEIGTVDVLINNAGVVGPLGSATTIRFEEWATTMAVNVSGSVQLTLTLLPGMVTQRWGRVVSVVSGTMPSMAAMVGANAYATSKTALEMFTLNLAAELDGTGVRVNAYRPGPVDTQMQEWIRRQDPAAIGSAAALHGRFVQSHASGRLVSPESSARALLDRMTSDAHGEVWNFRDPDRLDGTR